MTDHFDDVGQLSSDKRELLDLLLRREGLDLSRLGTFVAPRTEQEHTLAMIWQEVLGVERISIHDNFFDIGGDSILSLLIVAKASKVGLRLTTRRLFLNPTIAGLAAHLEEDVDTSAEQGLVIGDLPKLPVHHWFLEMKLPNPNHWNVAALLALNARLDKVAFGSAMQSLVRHHDALRLRFVRRSDGWSLRILGDEYLPQPEFMAIGSDGDSAVAKAAMLDQIQQSLDLERGPVLRAVVLELPDGATQLLMAFHHLVVDWYSMRVLLHDLDLAYGQALRHQPIVLPAKTTSYKDWATRLAGRLGTGNLEEARLFWAAAIAWRAPRLRVDGTGPNTEQSVRRVSVGLTREETTRLIQETAPRLHADVQDLLIASSAIAVLPSFERRQILLDLEGHGRKDAFSDVDLSRTVGWFMTLCPLFLDLQDMHTGLEVLRQVKQGCRAMSPFILDYGLLRYGSEGFHPGQDPEICFNYLGQFERSVSSDGPFELTTDDVGRQTPPSAARKHLINIVAYVHDGMLEVVWLYSNQCHRAETIEKMSLDFVTALRNFSHVNEGEVTRGLIESDFPDSGLDAVDLAAVLERRR